MWATWDEPHIHLLQTIYKLLFQPMSIFPLENLKWFKHTSYFKTQTFDCCAYPWKIWRVLPSFISFIYPPSSFTEKPHNLKLLSYANPVERHPGTLHEDDSLRPGRMASKSQVIRHTGAGGDQCLVNCLFMIVAFRKCHFKGTSLDWENDVNYMWQHKDGVIRKRKRRLI